MKKIIAVLLVLMMSLALLACNKDSGNTTASNGTDAGSSQTNETTAAETTTAEETTAGASENSGTLKSGDEGNGPKTLESALIKVDIPKGLDYKIGSYSMYESNPLYGNIMIMIKNEKGMVAAKINASSQNMVTNQKEAVEKVISLFNLGSYKEGKSSVKDGVKYGENEYSLVKISTENYKKDCFVTYVADRSSTDEKGLMLYLEVDLKQIASDDPMIKEILNSITVVKA